MNRIINQGRFSVKPNDPADLILDNYQSKEAIMYTSAEKEKALELFDKTKSIAKEIRKLGYPSKQTMYTWIANRNKP